MTVELIVPEVGESITEVQIGTWLKSVGDVVETDEGLVEIDTDKVSFELPAPVRGKIVKILKDAGDPATVGEVIGFMEAAEGGGEAPAAADPEPEPVPEPTTEPGPAIESRIMPAAQRLMAEHGIPPADVTGTGPGGRVLKEDVERAIAEKQAPSPSPAPGAPAPSPAPAGEEEVVPMSPLRRRVAERLVDAQQTMALLTTFNEIDMTAVMALRKTHGEAFLAKHGVKLGFMSFFVKAVIDALKLVPVINGEIRDSGQGGEIVYRNHYDIGVAVGGGKGLVVPVVRGADRLSFAEVEQTIADLAERAQKNRLTLEELSGGTFTISNGGIYGSLLSTPIVNPPQSGILGLHAIQQRPVGIDGEIVLRPMMYVAVTYDHRIVDGREAVTFLRRIKDCIENPSRMLLEI
ncbi:MAG: 2-oxoglutarate dehydrogenase complex dihydrolipoyllysine-residue succinyltransferase [Planctomycetota bacterium]